MLSILYPAFFLGGRPNTESSIARDSLSIANVSFPSSDMVDGNVWCLSGGSTRGSDGQDEAYRASVSMSLSALKLSFKPNSLLRGEQKSKEKHTAGDFARGRRGQKLTLRRSWLPN
jgi:hypothetical protein